jgi:hypothetical protein
MDRFLKPAGALPLLDNLNQVYSKAGARPHSHLLSSHRFLQRETYPVGPVRRLNLIQRSECASMSQMYPRRFPPQVQIAAPSVQFAAGMRIR